MGLNLTIDQGNSSAKIAVWDGAKLVSDMTVPTLSQAILSGVVKDFAPQRALICTVTGNGRKMAKWLATQGVDASEVRYDMPLPIKLGYTNPQTLGEDRIAACAGACSLFPGENLLVVDMGTAVTYDFVSADGTFVGGNIAPGIGMRLRSLNSFTARLPLIQGYGDTPLLGYDTPTAMRSGAVFGVVGEILYYKSQLPADTRVVLTGGWSAHISKILSLPVTVDKCLVTKGLLSILLYNEQ